MAKDVRVKITADSKDLEKGIDKGTKSLKGLDKQLDKTDKSLKETDKQTGLATQGFQKMGAAITAAVGTQMITRVVSGLTSMNMELLEVGVRAQGVQKAFGNIADADLSDLRTAVKGTVSDLTLMESAVKADKFGIPVQKMGDLLKFAAQSAKDTGENVDMLASKISVAIGRKSLMILDDFGITAAQITKELGGMSAQAASVEQLTDAVLRISQATMKNADTTFDTADAYNTLLATIENIKMEGGDMLTDSEELKDTIMQLTSTITTNAPAILKFITDWGIGAAKIATYMAEVAGFWSDVFTNNDTQKSMQIQEVINATENLNKVREESAKQIAKIQRLERQGKTVVNAKTIQDQAKAEIKAAEDNVRRQQMLLNGLIRTENAEAKFDKAKNERLRNEDEAKKKAAQAEEERLKRLELLKKQAAINEKERIKALNSLSMGDVGAGLSAMNAPSISQIGENLDQNSIAQIAGKEAGYDAFITDFNTKIEKMEIERAELIEKAQIAEMEQRQVYFDSVENIISSSQTAMVDSINFFANKSIETFTQMSTSIIASTTSILKSLGDMGAGGGLFGTGSSLLGGLGILGAGIGLVGGVASALMNDDSETIDSGYDAEEPTGLSSSTPSTTVTQQKQTVNNYTNITLNTGAYMGDEESLRQTAVLFDNIVATNNLGMA